MSAPSYKHIDRDERLFLESNLNRDSISLKLLASQINRSSKAIRNEIKRHRYLLVRDNKRNKCGRQTHCSRKHLCDDCENGSCKACRYHYCNDMCPDFTSEPDCKRIKRFPFVCNGCPNIGGCPMPKLFYNADRAHAASIQTCVKQRSMNKIPETLIAQIDQVVSEGVARGLSIEVIVVNSNLPVSISTVYRLIDNNELPHVKNLSLKRKVRFASKTAKSGPKRPDPARRYGRTYNDFISFIATQSSDTPIWQMDTVIGKKGKNEKCVLTLLHTQSNLQLFFLLDEHTSSAVSQCIGAIRRFLGDSLFQSTFSVILTDNGLEFANVDLIERSDVNGEQLIHLFYCDPYQSQQKGKCEKNHEHFREMVPKGVSMNPLSQRDINFVSANVNNYPRRKFNLSSPLKIALMMLNERILQLNKLIEIPINSINLTRII